MPGLPDRLTRRRFLTVAGGATAGAVLLGACGDDDTSAETGNTPSTETDGGATGSGFALAQLFGGPMFVAGGAIRAPFGLADTEGLLPAGDTPASLAVTIVAPDGSALEEVEVRRRDEGLERAYFPLRFTAPEAGIYTARAEVDGEVAEMAFNVDEAAAVQVVQPGDALPAVETPTAEAARGVDPICTAEPVCPLHEVTVAEARTEGRPLALLVATPAFCQIEICGPVLDVLLDVRGDHPDIRFLHAEVYADPLGSLEEYAPVVDALGLHFEPCLVLADAAGTVVERLDTIYDRSEVSERLGELA